MLCVNCRSMITSALGLSLTLKLFDRQDKSRTNNEYSGTNFNRIHTYFIGFFRIMLSIKLRTVRARV